jgi:hypothetical protein
MFCQSQSSGDSCLQRKSLLSSVFFICKCYFVGYVCNYGISRWENISFFWRHWKFYVKTENGVFLPLKIVDSQTIANYNQTLKNHDKVFDDKWRFKHVKVVCCHNGVPRDRCGGKRPNLKVFPCQCPFFPCGLPTDCQIFHNFVDVRQNRTERRRNTKITLCQKKTSALIKRKSE